MSKNKPFIFAGLSIAILAFSIVASAAVVSAQTTNTSGQALEIAPPVVFLTADPGQTVTTKISLRNISKGSLLVTDQINDFVANGEDGVPKVVLDQNETNPNSMKSWVTPLPDLTMTSKQVKSLPVTVSVPKNASPGGYYSVIRFTATPPELKGTGVSLSASLGALVFMRVKGQAKESMSIAGFSVGANGQTGSFFESAPLEFSERIKNTGNIYEQPTGQVTVTDMFGKKIATVNVNLALNYVLPNSTRKFTQPLDRSVIGDRILFGRYTADMKITYGTDKQVITKSITFWVIPYKLIAVIVALIIGIASVLYFSIRRYNRYIVKQAQKSRRKK